jgi:hypothetical protein
MEWSSLLRGRKHFVLKEKSTVLNDGPELSKRSGEAELILKKRVK